MTDGAWASTTIRVFGIPKAQPRVRARAFTMKLANGREITTARAYESGTAEGWKSDIARGCEMMRPLTPHVGPLRVDIVFLFPRTKAELKPKSPVGRMLHTKKPDRDNLDKAVLDSLKLLGYFIDDSQVCLGEASKWIVARDERPGCIIRISDASNVVGRIAEDVETIHEVRYGEPEEQSLFAGAWL